MSDLSLDPKEITKSLQDSLKGWEKEVKDDLVGHVLTIADGVARVVGLEDVMASELLEFPGDLVGVALNLEEDSIGVVLMGDATGVEEGMPVKQTGKVLSIGGLKEKLLAAKRGVISTVMIPNNNQKKLMM